LAELEINHEERDVYEKSQDNDFVFSAIAPAIVRGKNSLALSLAEYGIGR